MPLYYNQGLQNANKLKRKEVNMFKNLDAEQARRSMTNSDVAQALHITRATYENKKKTGKFNTSEAKTLCYLFGCGFDYLFATADDEMLREKFSA